MKKIIIISCTIASLLLILDSVGAGHMIMMFLLVGTIPGTDSSLSPTQMLALISSLSVLAIFRIGLVPLIRKKPLAT